MAKPTWEDFQRELPRALDESVRARPDLYFYGPEKVPQIAERILFAFESGPGAAHNSVAVRLACARVGIKQSTRAIKALVAEWRERRVQHAD